ncbi:MAG: PLP-dependent aminotransferase family protein [Coprobacillus sp.]
MLTYHFSENKKIPMYEHLYLCLKRDIMNKQLKAHDKLPSKRAFAKHLQVSIITVENAYAQLLIEGYIYSIEKKGYFISEVEYLEAPNTKPIILLEEEPKDYIIDLKTNSVSPSDFPYSVWSKLTRHTLSQQDALLLIKPPQKGCVELRKAIAQHLRSFSGMDVSFQQIIVGAGTEYLYHLVIQLLGRNQIYALEDPGHHSISKVYQTNEVTFSYIPLDKSGIYIKKLKESHAKVVHISPAHHYPTGITMPIKRRMELLNWANEENSYIIEDDYDSEFRLRGKPIPTLFQTDQKEHVIYMNTFSKTLAPSFRISYMVLPNHLVSLYQEKLGFYACSVSSLEQVILAKFIQDGYFEKHINRMRNYYKTIRDEFLDELHNSNLATHIKITEENAGLHFLLHYQKDSDDIDIIKKANKIGLNVSPLSAFYSQHSNLHTLVINYSGLRKEQIPIAVELLNKLIKKR